MSRRGSPNGKAADKRVIFAKYCCVLSKKMIKSCTCKRSFKAHYSCASAHIALRKLEADFGLPIDRNQMQLQKKKKFQLLKAGGYMKTITRSKYMDRIIELNGTPDIKIITGIRRSGKSKLMEAYIDYLKTHVENINIIFIDFMDLSYEKIKEYHMLHSYVEEH